MNMQINFYWSANEKGSVMLITLLMLMLLTLIGFSAISTANIETAISGNEKVYKQNFYMAEGAMREAVQRIQNETIPDQLRAGSTSHKWINSCSDLDSTSWGNNGQGGTVNFSTSGLGSNFEVFDGGIARGNTASSIKVTSTSVHEYLIYGQSVTNNAQTIIEAGFKKRF